MRALDSDDQRADLFNTLGVCYFKKNQFEQAIHQFEQAVSLNPASAMDYANLGVNHQKLGNTEQAIHYYSLAIDLDGTLDFARERLYNCRQNPIRNLAKWARRHIPIWKVNIYLLRHGATDLSGNFVGTTDIPLAEEGIRQAKKRCSVISPLFFDRVYCSPFATLPGRRWTVWPLIRKLSRRRSCERLISATGRA
jgi:tetratricopeptide (TPR) repeat protein